MRTYGSMRWMACWRDIIARMMNWLDAMSHPDLRIAFFNDAAFGIAPEPAQLRAYAARLNISPEPFERSGPASPAAERAMSAWSCPLFYLACDIALIGPGPPAPRTRARGHYVELRNEFQRPPHPGELRHL